MKISIIVPVFNGIQFLPDLLTSLDVGTSNGEIEFVFVDDGSTDGTSAFLKNQGGIKLIEQKNSGVSKSRNIGIEQSIGDYISFVDADDLLETGWQRILLDLVDRYFGFDYIVMSNNDLNINGKSEMMDYIIGKQGVFLSGPYSKLYKRSFLNMNNIRFNESIINGEDMLFNLTCAAAAKDFVHVRKPFYRYRVYMGSSTKRFDQRFVESDSIFRTCFCDIISKSGQYSDEKMGALKTRFYTQSIIEWVYRITCMTGYKTIKARYEERWNEIEWNEGCSTFLSAKNRLIYKLFFRKRFLVAYLLVKASHAIRKKKASFRLI